jgi:prephenate dehydrogenase
VLEIEKSTSTIFDLAGSGFESTVRLAKSSPAMWTPIFEQNAQFVCEALDAYIKNITTFKELLEAGHTAQLARTMEEANAIRRVLAGMNGVKNEAKNDAKNDAKNGVKNGSTYIV